MSAADERTPPPPADTMATRQHSSALPAAFNNATQTAAGIVPKGPIAAADSPISSAAPAPHHAPVDSTQRGAAPATDDCDAAAAAGIADICRYCRT